MTFLVSPTSALIYLAAIYYGATYGGAISSIMLRGIFLLILPLIRLIQNKREQR